MKKILKILAFCFLALFIFKGYLYRAAIKYTDIGIRPTIEISNQKLVDLIKAQSENKILDINEISEIAKDITNKALQFTTKNTSSNPDEIVETNRANCVGYSALFNSIANYLIVENGLQKEIIAEHKIGQLELFGEDIHQYFENSFFRDHDFNELKNLKTGSKVIIDPSVSDYLWINRVSKNE